MVTINFEAADGGGTRSVAAKTGQSAMIAARDNGVQGIVAVCGGNMLCGTCHVVVAEDWADRVGPAGEDEAAVLEALGSRAEVQSSSRLACQITLTPELEGLTVRVPRYQPGV